MNDAALDGLDKTLIMRLIEYAIKKEKAVERIFIQDIYKDLNVTANTEKSYINETLIAWNGAINSNHILVPAQRNGGVQDSAQLKLNPDALFSYIDHLEIVHARTAAQEARRFSIAAIWISLGSLALTTAQVILQITFGK